MGKAKECPLWRGPRGGWEAEDNKSTPAGRLCRNRKEAVTIVIPAKVGIQNMLKILDSVSRFACTE